MSTKIDAFVQSPPLSPIDVHFARLMEKMEGGKNPDVLLAAALVSFFRNQGHICFDLEQFSERMRFGEIDKVPAPPRTKWLKQLRNSAVVGKPGEFRPLILDENNRLYLHRYWDYERRLAARIKARLQIVPCDDARLREGLERLFGKVQPGAIDWQKVAAFTAVTRRFCVISGGPGTGKTSTVVKILTLLLEQADRPLRVALAAPTGKAAGRLQDAIKNAKAALGCAQTVRDALPESASTIHRLLGSVSGSPFFRRNATNQLPVDVVVVDEASMVDLALMVKLLEAVPATARLILLGDKDQLSSVEAGAVLADICGGAVENNFSSAFAADYKRVTGEEFTIGAGETTLLSDYNVQLVKNYRFGEASEIFRLSQSVREGSATAAASVLQESKTEVHWLQSSAPEHFEAEFKRCVVNGFKPYLTADNPLEMLKQLNRFRVLAAVRNGPFGVTELNGRIEHILALEGLIDPGEQWYKGRPIMVTVNDYTLDLFNGDIGLIAFDTETNQCQAYFLGKDNNLRKVLPIRLPAHETVYAMTVHKSQGSEFENVLFVLPDKDSAVLTRELIYTGISRARARVEIWTDEKNFSTAVRRRVQRWSGLADRLRDDIL